MDFRFIFSASSLSVALVRGVARACVVVTAWPRPQDLGQCSHLLMGSLERSNIGDVGARDLGMALQVNTTLTTLK
jgi:hypothetical protein